MLQSKMFDFADAALEFVSEEADFNVFFLQYCRNLQKWQELQKLLK